MTKISLLAVVVWTCGWIGPQGVHLDTEHRDLARSRARWSSTAAPGGGALIIAFISFFETKESKQGKVRADRCAVTSA